MFLYCIKCKLCFFEINNIYEYKITGDSSLLFFCNKKTLFINDFIAYMY